MMVVFFNNNKVCVICVIYRLSNLELFLNMLEILLEADVQVVVCVDFNIDMLSMDKCRNRKQFIQLVTSYYMKFTIDMPTRVCNQSMFCLNNICFSNFLQYQTRVGNFNISDQNKYWRIWKKFT